MAGTNPNSPLPPDVGAAGSLSAGQALEGIGMAGASAIVPIATTLLQGHENMRLARYQASANERYLDRYLEYNTPANQMRRFQDAGLNPHLIYGQGTPGNQAAPLTHPEIKPRDFGALMQMIPMINQSRLTDSQVQATDAKTRQTGALTELNKLQAQVLAANPALNEAGYKAMIQSLVSSAEIKASEASTASIQANWFKERNWYQTGEMEYTNMSNGQRKLDVEMNLLDQRFNLSKLDADIKAKVLTSKEFQNAILEVQKKFMVDADITPQHYMDFIKMLLMYSIK